MSEIKIDLTLLTSNFLFLLCFKIVTIKLIPMCKPTGQRHNFYSYLFSAAFDAFSVCTGYDVAIEKNSLKFGFINRYLNICKERMPTKDLGGLTSPAFSILC